MCKMSPTSHQCVECIISKIPLPLWWPPNPNEETHARPRPDRSRPRRCTTADDLKLVERRIRRGVAAASGHSATVSRVKVERRLAREGATITRSQTAECAGQAANRESKAVLVNQRKSRNLLRSLNQQLNEFTGRRPLRPDLKSHPIAGPIFSELPEPVSDVLPVSDSGSVRYRTKLGRRRNNYILRDGLSVEGETRFVSTSGIDCTMSQASSECGTKRKR